MKESFTPKNDLDKDIVVYRDERYALGLEKGRPYLIADGRRLLLTCHPYEPCLYITGEDSKKTAVHNAFDPSAVLESFGRGETVESVTGRRYGAPDFCRMVEYAAGKADIGIDDAEKVLGARPKQEKTGEKAKKGTPGAERVIRGDPCHGVINEYPDCEAVYCLVKNVYDENSRDPHLDALACACSELFFDGREQIWAYDTGAAKKKRQICAEELFAAPKDGQTVNYRSVFMNPSEDIRYTVEDFERVNSALFPRGTDGLEVFEWTTDWSEFFCEEHGQRGAVCFTVYDKNTDRFAVIMA